MAFADGTSRLELSDSYAFEFWLVFARFGVDSSSKLSDGREDFGSNSSFNS